MEIEKDVRIPKKRLQKLYPDSGEAYYDFLRRSRDDREVDAEDLREICRRLVKGKSKVDGTPLSILQDMSTASKFNPSRPVQKAREALREYFTQSSTGKAMRQEGALPVLYGSLEFNDPVNLDADILMVTNASSSDRLKQQCFHITYELITLWDARKLALTEIAEPHASLLSLGNLDLESLMERPEWLFGYAGDLSIAISGIPVLEDDLVRWERFRDKAKDITESNPLICALVNHAFVICLSERVSKQYIPTN